MQCECCKKNKLFSPILFVLEGIGRGFGYPGHPLATPLRHLYYIIRPFTSVSHFVTRIVRLAIDRRLYYRETISRLNPQQCYTRVSFDDVVDRYRADILFRCIRCVPCSVLFLLDLAGFTGQLLVANFRHMSFVLFV